MMKSLFETIWRYLNSPVDELWVVILVAAVFEAVLLALVYYAGPYLGLL